MNRSAVRSRGGAPVASRAFSLIEVVMVVVILAIAVPPTLGILMDNASSRADTIHTSRASMLASSVLEGIIADVASVEDGLGFGALDDPGAYLDTPTTGFVARMRPITDDYAALGITYTVEIGELVDSGARVSVNEDENIFRVVTVRVRYRSSNGADLVMPVSVMVSSL